MLLAKTVKTVDRFYPALSLALKRGVNEIATLVACILLFQMPRAEARGSLLGFEP